MLSDLQHTVDQIRTHLQADDQTMRDEFNQLATDYKNACIAVNDRLKECHHLLAQGLRSEAIHKAESEPDLLETALLLDFPDRTAWEEIVINYGLDEAPRIDADLTKELQEAYAEVDPLAKLLRRHRLYALSRASLGRRSSLLAKIAEVDPMNPIWEEDLKTYHLARVEEIRVDLTNAIQQNDLATLERLRDEVETTSWRAGAVDSIARAIQNYEARVRRQHALGKLPRIAEALAHCYQTRKIDQGRAVRERWNKYEHRAELGPQDPIRLRAEPALAWLAEEDRQALRQTRVQGAIAALEQALETSSGSVSRTKLEELHKAILGLGEKVPGGLETSYRDRLKTLDRQRAWRRRIGFIGAAVLILTTSLIASVVGWQQWQQRRLKETRQAVSELLDQGDYAEALRRVDGLGLDLIQSEGVRTLRLKVIEDRDQDQARRGQFDLLIEGLQGLLQQELTELDSPTLERINKARSFAKTTSEHAAIDQLEAKLNTTIEAQHQANEAKLRPEVEKIAKQIGNIEQDLLNSRGNDRLFSINFNDASVALDQLNDQAREGVSNTFRQQIADLEARLKAIRVQRREESSRSEAEQRITDSLRYNSTSTLIDLSRYLRAVDAYIAKFPGSELSVGFQKTIPQRPSWDAAAAWSALVNSSRLTTLTRFIAGPVETEQELEDFLRKHQRGPDRARALELLSLIKPINQRKQLLDRLERYCANPVMSFYELNYENSIFFLIEKPPSKPGYRGSGRVTVNRVKTRSLETQPITPSPPRDVVRRIKPSAQAMIVKKIRSKIAGAAFLQEWDREMLSLLQQIKDSEELNPVLKGEMLLEIGSIAGEGSLPLKTALFEQLNAIDWIAEESIDWMDTQRLVIRNHCNQAEESIAQSIDIAAVIRELDKERGSLEGDLNSSYQPIGWLSQSNSTWVVRSSFLPQSLNDARLYTIDPEDGKQPDRWVTIGRIQGQTPRVTRRSFPDPAIGRPVFVITPTEIP